LGSLIAFGEAIAVTDSVAEVGVVALAAALTAVAPLEAISLPPPQDTSPNIAAQAKLIKKVRMKRSLIVWKFCCEY
jgi:hypothetical protein